MNLWVLNEKVRFLMTLMTGELANSCKEHEEPKLNNPLGTYTLDSKDPGQP